MSVTPFISSTQNDNTMVLAARRYQAAGTGTEVLVRLVPQELVPAEDLALATLGLHPADLEPANQQPTTPKPTPIGFVPTRAVGFPAWPILTDPDNALHALNLVSDIQWIRRNARTHVKRVKERVDKLTNQLQASAPHFVPTFLEEIARIHLEADHASYAKQYFSKAREVERNHSLPVDMQRHQQAFREFTALGVVGSREMTAEAHNAAEYLEPEAAYQYFLELLLTCAHANVALYNQALRDLRRLGKAAGRTNYEVDVEFASQYVPAEGFLLASTEILRTLPRVLTSAHNRNPAVGRTLAKTCPAAWNLNDYLYALMELNHWEPLITDSDAFISWLIRLFEQQNHQHFFAVAHQDLLDAIITNGQALSGANVKIKIPRDMLTNLDYFDALVAAGVQVQFGSHGRLDMKQLWTSWFDNGSRDLAALVGNIQYKQLLIENLAAKDLQKHLDKLLSTEPTTEIVSLWLGQFAREFNRITYNRYRLKEMQVDLQYLTDPRLKELNPQAIAALFPPQPDEIKNPEVIPSNSDTSADSPVPSERTVVDLPNVSRTAWHYFAELTGISCYWDAQNLASCKDIATKISASESGIHTIGSSFTFLLGKEKLILSRLATPCLPLAEFHELIEFFTALARIGFLGKVVEVEMDVADVEKLRARNLNTLVLKSYSKYSALLRPETADSLEDSDSHFAMFMPRDEFLAKLTEIRNWRDSLNDEQRANHIAMLRESAVKLSEVTMLPPKVWHLVLVGVVQKPGRSGYNTEDAKLLGDTTTTLRNTDRLLISSRLNLIDYLMTGWHEDYLFREPNIEAIANRWQEQLGKPWIQLKDSNIEVLNKYMHIVWLPPEIYSEKAQLPADSSGVAAAFRFYFALMHLAEPQSAAAKEVASRLELFRNWKLEGRTYTFGGSYEQAGSGYHMLDYYFSPTLVSQGYLDQWLDFLVSGTAYNGTPEDPRVSATSVVAEVQAELGLSADAACYFLQILSLATPTDTLVKRWNGWNKKQLDAAASELLERGLVVEGKRASSGRRVFLAGGWLGKSTTGPAIEMWKAPHYLLWEASVSRPVLPGCPVLVPHGELFAQTWQRYQSGDVPGYEELRTSP